MKLALLSDIHANSRALEACLTHADSLGVQRLAVLGDTVGYGSEPAQVVQRVMTLAQQGAVVLQGNHDVVAVTPPPVVATSGDEGGQWTHAQLSPTQRQFLAELPLTHCEGSLLLYYRGTGRNLMAFLPTPGVAIPTPRLRSWIATVGSVGQPRDGRTEAMYAVFDTIALQLTFYRVPYDFQAAAASIRAAGLPEYFAKRLESGR
jgi:diadenosine tetraphosphatase ApaH/serine/threonine PP2A family protein phosphatase